ncbi:MAG TPA: M14 family zinc carboxypeptidase [Gemmatimonadaceae bacterium]|nr:M14 family zinc carboxypeptidase [Gemmatimonadaceae bacterium]
MRRLFAAGLCLAALPGCGAVGRAAGAVGRAIAEAAAAGPLPRTRAERTQYRETSSHADVVAFLDSLQAAGLPVALGSLGASPGGRDIPLAIASRPLVRTPAEARRLGRPVVFVQANIHAGEVEGKEALLALLRDLLASTAPNALDSVVVVAVPIYNADGNEQLAPQARNRAEQNGPELVGVRANGQGLDLNRDYVKAEAPETRGALAALAAWDPDVFVDLHTTDGSFHGYALTYAPPLAPVGGAARFTRDSLLPVLRERMRTRHRFETFDYGNFDGGPGSYGGFGATADATPDSAIRAWGTYDHRPRFGTNYVGLRGRVAILSEAFSHDPFERRVASTSAFVREILSLAGERRASLVRLARESAAGVVPGDSIAIRSRLTTRPSRQPVLVEEIERTGDSTITEPGVPRGLRRSGRYRSLQLAVYDRFEPELTVAAPAGYLLAPGSDDIVRMLRTHGVVVERAGERTSADVEAFTVDSIVTSRRQFQGHFEERVFGRWRRSSRAVERGAAIVPLDQALAPLAVYLLEPGSDDGLATWNLLDAVLRRGAEFPVARLASIPRGPRRLVP